MPGLEIAGEVAALGAGVPALAVGDAVLRAGARRRLCRILRGPRDATPAGAARLTAWSKAAAIPGNLLHRLAQRVRARPARKPARRCWSMAARPASARRRSSSPSAFGARVIATAGIAEKCAACRQARRRRGDQLPDARISSPRSRRRPAARGVDVILDMVGGDYVARNYEAAGRRGPHRPDRRSSRARREHRLLRRSWCKRLIHHRLDAAAAHRRRSRRRSPRRLERRSGRCSRRARSCR